MRWPAEERLAFFEGRGIQYYLRVPNEFSHPVNWEVGLDELIDRGDLVLIESFGNNELYEFRYNEQDRSAPSSTE